jgi:hypothetical protein
MGVCRMAARHRVTALGLVGAGKTVYLTMLTETIFSGEVLDPGIGWSLEPASDELDWHQRYLHLADTGQRWPNSTPTDEQAYLTIVLSVTRRHRKHRALEISYNDSSGENVQPQPGIDTAFYNKVITDSDALLVFIDGDQLLSLLTGGQTADEFYQNAVDKLMRPMELTSGPVHVVITKWDRLASRDGGLAEARDALRNLGVPRWRQFLDTREQRAQHGLVKSGIVRLIPVSSVGEEFARAKNAAELTGPAVLPRPFNIDIPLVAALRDLAYVDVQDRYTGQGRDELATRPGSYGGDTDFTTRPAILTFHLQLIEIVRLAVRFVVVLALAARRRARHITAYARILGARRRAPSSRRVRDEDSAIEFIMATLERRTALAEWEGLSCILAGDRGGAAQQAIGQ